MSNESLSALLDGECSSEELDRTLAEIGRSPELAKAWSRLCLTREMREGTRMPADQRCICAGVMGAIAGLSAEAGAGASGKVVGIDSRRSRMGRAARSVAWKPVAGFAAAASVGAAAVLLLTPDQWSNPAPSGPAGVMEVSQQARTDDPVGGAEAVSVESELAAVPNAAQRRLLREYLMNHSSSVAEQGVGGTLRYARFAAYTTDGSVSTDGPR